MDRYQKSQNIDVGPLKRPIPKIMLIFSISRLKKVVTNNLLLISTGKLIIIDIGYCYQPILIMDQRCYNKSFSISG
jgi:hypothetical protein